MTRAQLFDQFLIECGMDSADRRFDPRVVFMAMDTIRAALIPDYLTTYGESAVELFAVPLILPVQNDTIRDSKYVQLGVQILGMSDRTGLIQVTLPQDEENDFIPVPLGMLSVYSGLEAGGAAGIQMYWLEGQRIYFRKLRAGIPNILIKVVPTLYDILDESAQVPMPAEFCAMLITATKERLMPQQQGVAPIEDKSNDGRAGA